MSTPITLTGAYTCTHHNDKQRTECPVCLVVALTTEREKVRLLVEINEFVGSAQLKAEREKVRMLRAALESIADAWHASHETNPFRAGDVMLAIAEKALGEREA